MTNISNKVLYKNVLKLKEVKKIKDNGYKGFFNKKIYIVYFTKEDVTIFKDPLNSKKELVIKYDNAIAEYNRIKQYLNYATT